MKNKETITVVLLAIINFILLSTIFQYFRFYGILPNTVIILIVSITIIMGKKYGMLFAIISGFLVDIFLSRAIGVNLSIYVLMVFFLGLFEESLFEGSFVTPVVTIGMVTFFYYMIFLIIMFFLNEPVPMSIFKEKIMFEVIYNCLLGVFIYGFVFKKVNGYRIR